MQLVADGSNFEQANKQAQQELFAAFGLQKYAGADASTLTITAGTNEAAALIAVSALVLVDRRDDDAATYLAQLCNEFGQSGSFSDATKNQIKADRNKLAHRLSAIRFNVIGVYFGAGLTVDVKELSPFFDWNDDGTAGNEMLSEGETVTLEKTELNIPNTGGTYTIGFTSPIPVYLEPTASGGLSEGSLQNIYDATAIAPLEKSIANNVLTIKVGQLHSRIDRNVEVCLYDYSGNLLATLKVRQAGNPNASMPRLGSDAIGLVSTFTTNLDNGFSQYKSILSSYERYTDVMPGSSYISGSWGKLHQAINYNLRFKYIDAQKMGIYQDIFNVFSALCYYNMVVGWGDVPYHTTVYTLGVPPIESLTRTDKTEILNDLEKNLLAAISSPSLEEKKNKPLSNDVNDYFFVSKDVARILLADIYMYQSDFASATPPLAKVIENGFYSLNAPNIFAWNASSIPLTYTDVLLSYAECLYKVGKLAEANNILNQVVSAKNISVSSDTFTGIKEARKQLLAGGISNFAFMKRNNLAKDEYRIDDYQLLFPIPLAEIERNPSMTQNPGYE